MCGAAQNVNQVTLCEIYSDWRAVYFRKIGRKGKEGYENAWKTLSVLGQSQIQELTIQDSVGISPKVSRPSVMLLMISSWIPRKGPPTC